MTAASGQAAGGGARRHVRARLALVAVLGALLTLVLPAGPAMACTCAGESAAEMLATPRADAAFVGRLVGRRPASDPGPLREVAYRFRVESVVKGELPGTVEVVSAGSGAACGFDLEVGDHAGIVVQRTGDTWTGGLCRTTAPAEMLAAGDPRPPASTIPWPSLLGVGAVAVLATTLWAYHRRQAERR